MRMVIVVALAATAPHAALAASAAGAGNSEFVKNLVATLEASANSGGLRTIDPSEINTIVLQDHLIQDSRRQMAAGTLDKDLGERVIATCEEAIRRFIHSVGNEALAIADSGRASDAARLGKTLGTLLSVTRQQILLGHEDDLALDGAKQIKMLGQIVPVAAHVDRIDSMSAHADAGEIMRWLGGFTRPPAMTHLVHGEPAALEALKGRITTTLGWPVHVARYLERVGVD